MMAYPVKRALHKVSRGYIRGSHCGVDIAPISRGVSHPVYAVGTGRVVGVGMGTWRAGKNVMIQLADGSLWWYSHLSRVDVKRGESVVDGVTVLGMTGNTGFSFGVHLHLERHWPKIDVETDPWPFIRNEPDPGAAKVSTPAVPRPARTLRVGARARLASPWRRYKYSTLRGAMVPSTLRAGDYRVIAVDNGSALLESLTPGYKAQGWVHGQALVSGGGIVG